MASQSLYRKHRPQRFAELVGQEHVTLALRNVIREGRVGHAYLFSGPRGTGKTTTARILAKALNCLHLTGDGEPCACPNLHVDECAASCDHCCENCEAIARGTFFDLVELDAASHRGVNEARDLVQRVAIGLGPGANRKVYVIDEVHMLTPDASNTLLKTLEEPPEHVVFVLATTDPQKVLPTIRSRTQHFEFTLLSRDQLIAHLADILGREGIEADPDALDLVARRAGGSARDALSYLDQALAVGGGRLDGSDALTGFAGTHFEQRVSILEAVANEDVAGALAGAHEAITGGHDPRRLTDDLVRTLRDAFLIANSGGRVPYDGPPDERDRLDALARSLGNAALVRGIEVLGQAIVDIRGLTVADPRLVLEVAIVRLARRESRAPLEVLLDRVERLERSIGSGATAPPVLDGRAARASQPSAGDAESPQAGAAAEPQTANPGGSHLSPRRPRAPRSDPAEQSASDAATSALAVAVVERAREPDPPDLVVDTGRPVEAPVVVDYDDVVEAWPVALGGLKAPIAAAIQDAQPIGVEDGVIVFGVPRVRYDAISARFRQEADAIKQAFSARLGFAPRFRLHAHDFEALDAFQPVGSGPVGASAPDVVHVDDHIDLTELVDAGVAPPGDSVSSFISDFGAEVVEERRRD